MDKYIDASLFLKALANGHSDGSITGPEDVEKLVREFPIADVKEVIRGKWFKFSSDEFGCTSCGKIRHYDTLDGVDPDKFCPNCGADMGVPKSEM